MGFIHGMTLNRNGGEKNATCRFSDELFSSGFLGIFLKFLHHIADDSTSKSCSPMLYLLRILPNSYEQSTLKNQFLMVVKKKEPYQTNGNELKVPRTVFRKATLVKIIVSHIHLKIEQRPTQTIDDTAISNSLNVLYIVLRLSIFQLCRGASPLNATKMSCTIKFNIQYILLQTFSSSRNTSYKSTKFTG